MFPIWTVAVKISYQLAHRRGVRMSHLRKGRAGAVAGVAVAALALGTLSACGGSAGASSGDGGAKVTLNLVSYSTPQTAFEEIIKAFQDTPEGKNVDFKQSYGASGDQSRAVAAGQPADVVEFALAPDIKRLVDADMVAPTWDQGQYKGFVTKSVTSIIVRKGNPKNIHNWDDLIKPGIEVLNANPFTSGGARWNVMAAYGSQIQQGKTKAQATQYLNTLFHHIPVQDESARTALQTFTQGKGDALLSYENEAIFAQQNGQAVDYVVPDDTILIENPVAVTKNSSHPVQ